SAGSCDLNSPAPRSASLSKAAPRGPAGSRHYIRPPGGRHFIPEPGAQPHKAYISRLREQVRLMMTGRSSWSCGVSGLQHWPSISIMTYSSLLRHYGESCFLGIGFGASGYAAPIRRLAHKRERAIMQKLSEIRGAEDSPAVADIILPSQYFELIGTRSLSSEQRLMLAVMVDAVNIIHSCRGNGSVRKRSLYNETHEWVFTRGSGKAFSF